VGSWKVIPQGKGFYEFVFSSLEDRRRVLAWGIRISTQVS